MAKGTQYVQRLLHEYHVDHLDTSFKVVLLDSAVETIDERTGAKKIDIPNYQGLLKAVALSRASHPQKMSGADIRFLRKTLEMKAKDLAEKLDISAEHLSRCEAGERILSANSEKVLRLLVFAEPLAVLKATFQNAPGDIKDQADDLLLILSDLEDILSGMKIDPFRATHDHLVLFFVHEKASQICPAQLPLIDEHDALDGKWRRPTKMAA